MKFQLSKKQISSNLVNETIILNHHDGLYYGLNEVGTFIWEKIKKKPVSIAEIKEDILHEYEINESTCEDDIRVILQKLIDEKLVETV